MLTKKVHSQLILQKAETEMKIHVHNNKYKLLNSSYLKYLHMYRLPKLKALHLTWRQLLSVSEGNLPQDLVN